MGAKNMKKNRVRCLWCFQEKAKPKRIVLNRDGTKNMSDPWLYITFLLGVGITIVPQLPAQWQQVVTVLLFAIGTVVVTRLILWRRTLPPGVEYRCSFCGFRWYEDLHVHEAAAQPAKVDKPTT